MASNVCVLRTAHVQETCLKGIDYRSLSDLSLKQNTMSFAEGKRVPRILNFHFASIFSRNYKPPLPNW